MDSRMLVSACLLCMMVVINAQVFEREHYPNPQLQPYECGRGEKKSYICDPNKLLLPGEAVQLDREIEKLMNLTTCPCSFESCSKRKYFNGFKLAVALMNKFPEETEMKKDEDYDELEHNLDRARLYAYSLLTTWKFGACEEDMVILYSKENNVLYTITGDVTQKKLKNQLVGTISMEGRGHFGKDTTFDGLLYLITKYREVLSGEYKTQPVKKPQTAALTDSSAFTLTSTTFIIMCSLLAAIFSL